MARLTKRLKRQFRVNINNKPSMFIDSLVITRHVVKRYEERFLCKISTEKIRNIMRRSHIVAVPKSFQIQSSMRNKRKIEVSYRGTEDGILFVLTGKVILTVYPAKIKMGKNGWIADVKLQI